MGGTEILKKFRLGLALVFGLVAAAHSARADKISVFVIAPPTPIVWESPRTLLQTTVQSSFKSNYAPNGHLMILLEQGGHAWLTSMASARKFQTFSLTVRRGLGLSSLYHDFEGELESAEDSMRMLNRAIKDERAAEIEIDVTPALMSQMLKFINQWIQQGSFRHYQGGQIASGGLGAGCADFVMWFMHQALDAQAPLKSWVRDVYLPKDLLAEGTSPFEINRRYEWAKSEEDGRLYTIPDPQLIYQWVVAKNPIEKKLKLTSGMLEGSEVHRSARLISETPFKPPYALESDETLKDVWRSITVR